MAHSGAPELLVELLHERARHETFMHEAYAGRAVEEHARRQ